jgi:hypothetical protein
MYINAYTCLMEAWQEHWFSSGAVCNCFSNVTAIVATPTSSLILPFCSRVVVVCDSTCSPLLLHQVFDDAEVFYVTMHIQVTASPVSSFYLMSD